MRVDAGRGVTVGVTGGKETLGPILLGWLDATGLNDWGAPDGVGTLLGWRVVGDVCPGVGAAVVMGPVGTLETGCGVGKPLGTVVGCLVLACFDLLFDETEFLALLDFPLLFGILLLLLGGKGSTHSPLDLDEPLPFPLPLPLLLPLLFPSPLPLPLPLLPPLPDPLPVLAVGLPLELPFPPFPLPRR